MKEEKLSNKVVCIISFRDFRDPEYFIPKEILENSGFRVLTASNKIGTAIGAEGGEAKIDLLLENIKPKEFKAVIFAGGPGCLKNLDNEKSYNLIKETIKSGRILAAICISPVILAKSGVLNKKRATVWSSSLNKKPIKILRENGAIYEKKAVVSDGKIITANGPLAAKDFAKEIIRVLNNEKK